MFMLMCLVLYANRNAYSKEVTVTYWEWHLQAWMGLSCLPVLEVQKWVETA
jgi:hypothetical protein